MSNTNQSKEEGSFSGGAPLRKLLEYADDSDDGQYGTLSTSLVRELVNEALLERAALAILLDQVREYIPARARPVLLRKVDEARAALTSQSEAR